DAEVRRVYVLAVRRLTKPTILRPIARLVVTAPGRMTATERILERCGQDGVDSVVDQFLGATSSAQRAAYRDVLFRLTSARASLIQMLSDPRWYVVRQAAEFLGEVGAQDGERALADLLRHADERVRRAAARALGRIDSAFTLDALARAVSDDDARVRLEAVAAVTARKGGRAGSILAAALDQESDLEVQFGLLAGMGRVATPETVTKLAAAAAAASGFFASKKNNALRIGAITALGDARTPGALTALQGLANDRDKEIRDAVARTMRSQRSTGAWSEPGTRGTPADSQAAVS
ncbi:MAG: HEAT repeat domain-containing protein, partial [Gemmatimonadales bacterium]